MKLYLRGPDGKRAGLIDDYSSFTKTRKHAGYSSWSMPMNISSRLARFLEEPKAGIIMEDEGQTFSGPIAELNRKRDESTNTLEVVGYGDDIWIPGRWTQPCYPPYTLTSHDQQTGTTEFLMKYYVRANLGDNATTARRLPGLVVAENQNRGPVSTQKFRFEMLNESLSTCALTGAADFGYDMHQGVEGYDKSAIVFEVVEPEDKTRTAKFSVGLRNLAKYEYSIKRPTANWVIVAAGGEGTGRAFLEGGDATSIETWGRVEGPLIDRRDTVDLALMQQSRDEELTKGANKLAVSFTVSDTMRLRFNKDWGLHDRVTVDVEGVVFTEIVRETTETWSGDKPKTVSVVIGTPEANAPHVPQFFAKQRAALARTARLESRP